MSKGAELWKPRWELIKLLAERLVDQADAQEKLARSTTDGRQRSLRRQTTATDLLGGTLSSLTKGLNEGLMGSREVKTKSPSHDVLSSMITGYEEHLGVRNLIKKGWFFSKAPYLGKRAAI